MSHPTLHPTFKLQGREGRVLSHPGRAVARRGTPSSAVLFAMLLAFTVSAAAAASDPDMHDSKAHMAAHEHDAGEQGAGHEDRDEHEHEHSFSFGAPVADPVDRTIVITANDTMRFDPASIEVKEGEAIRFVVRNEGRLQHSFTLGTAAEQMEHEDEMKGMSMAMMAGHMDDDPNGMVIEPGTTGSLAWRFTKAGEVQFACHIPGHYAAGMKGSIEVE